MMRFLFTIVCLASFCLPAMGQSKKDLVYVQGEGRAISGTIAGVSPDAITMKVDGQTRAVPVETITRLMLKDDPAGLGSLRSSVSSGQLEQAQSQLNSLKPAGRDFVRDDIEFLRALVDAKLALRGQGSVTKAAGAIGAFIKKHPTSFRYYEACEVMGDLAMNLGRYSAAANYYDRISKARSEALQSRASLLLGNAWLRQAEPGKAEAHFRRASESSDRRTAAMGQVGLADCMALAGKTADGIRLVEKIIQENDAEDTELFAAAYNSLGRLHQAAGDSEQALDAFLHTDLLYFRESEAHAEALYHLVGLWSRANKPGDSAKAKRLLQQKYVSSPWAKK